MTSKKTPAPPAETAATDTMTAAPPAHPLPQAGGSYVIVDGALLPETPPQATDEKET